MSQRDATTEQNFTRRTLLRAATVVAGAAAIVASATAPAEAKMSQAAASYQDKPKNGQSCSSCSLFKPPNSCTLVDGTISPDGWCRFYSKKSS